MKQNGGSNVSGGLCSDLYAPNNRFDIDVTNLENPSKYARLWRIYEAVDENGDEKLMIQEISGFLKKLGM